MTSERGDIQIELLGTGTSTGIPVIGCSCRVCRSSDPRDKRLRCSCYVRTQGVSVLIDAGPDFRYQAMRAGIERIDAVLLTHHHFDHVVGLDDLRPYLFRNRRPIPCYGPRSTVDVVEEMFGYIFRDGSYPGVPKLRLEAVDTPFSVSSRDSDDVKIEVTPIPAVHGDTEVFGYRIGRFAYITDVSAIPESSMPLLDGLDVLVLDALRHDPHPMHQTIAAATDTAIRVGAGHTYFIHMTHSVLHAEEDALLPECVSLAYDGLTVVAGW